jgi:hypothetical protein
MSRSLNPAALCAVSDRTDLERGVFQFFHAKLSSPKSGLYNRQTPISTGGGHRQGTPERSGLAFKQWLATPETVLTRLNQPQTQAMSDPSQPGQ